MAESFAERWEAKLCALGLKAISGPIVSFGEVQLPAQAAPFLSFKAASHPAHIHDVFGAPIDWTASEKELFSKFMVIGHDGAGSPLCVEVSSGSVFLLDHDARFKTQKFVNSSVAQLAECLLAYQGEQNQFHFKSAVSAIDPKAMRPGTFWSAEAKEIG